MAPKRKARIKSSSTDSSGIKQPKKPRGDEESKSTPSECNISKPVVSCEKSQSGLPTITKEQLSKVGKSCTSDCSSMARPSATIISLFRKQKQDDIKKVCCPVCSKMVFYQKINQHLDNGCCGPIESNLFHVAESNGCEELKTSFDNENSRKTCGSLIRNDINNIDMVSGNSQKNMEIQSIRSTSTNHSCIIIEEKPNNFTGNCQKKERISGSAENNSLKCLRFSSDIHGDETRLLDDNKQNCKYPQSKCVENATQIGMGTHIAQTEQSSVPKNGSIKNTSNSIKTSSDEENDPMRVHEPYYLQNFNLTISTVLSNKEDRELFNKDDNEIVKSFQGMSEGAKKLYVRLFQRKFKWFQRVKIKYPKIGEDLEMFFQELVYHGFIQTEDNLGDLEEILKLLPASDIQEVAKSMHVINKNKGNTKKDLMQSLINHGKKQCSLFANNGDSIAKIIIKKSKKLLGSCVKLEPFPRNVFSRIILLFSLNLLADDDDNAGSQLSALFLINIGQVVYPSYEISRKTQLFCSRDELIRYGVANENLWQVMDAMENKKFDKARDVYEMVRVQFNESLLNLANGEERLLYSVNLPIHLRRFSCTWVYTRVCSRGVELLQRDKDYCGAVELLRQLLGQDKFCVSRRGWWWERLALNLDQHLKRPAEALAVLQQGLSDVRVRTGHRFALEQRAKKICEAKRNSRLHHHLSEITFTELKQPSVVTISGKRLSDEPVFVLHEVNSDGTIDNDTVSYCGVEEMALRYYRQQGFNEGIHGEGATFNTLFGLLMWDVIFAQDIPDVFRTPFQMAPLDIYCDNFYENRKEIITKRLDEIRNASVKELTDRIECTWTEHYGKTCVGITWDLFSGVEQIKGLAGCIGGCVLAGICERFAKDYRHTRSGLPDLVVWNSNRLKYKIVEVKGPNDRLSTKQHVWLDVLVSLGVDAEVLYVKAVGGRKIA